MKKIIVLVFFLLSVTSSIAQIEDLPEMNFDAEREKMSLGAEGKTVSDGVLTAPDNSQLSISDFQGSYLVIDLWATWCAPCIEEAPLYKQMAEKYKDKNVKFISISIDEDIDSWKSFISNRKWDKDQYWFGNKKDDPFLSLAFSEINIKDKTFVGITIPKYIIISPTGEILSNSGIRPSRPNFEEELQKYL